MNAPVFLASFASITWNVLGAILLIICFLLTIIILIQDSKGAGLTSAFGAGPGGESLLGARMQKDVARWTAILAGLFGVIVVIMGLLGTFKQKTSYGSVGAKPVAESKEQPSGAAGGATTETKPAGETKSTSSTPPTTPAPAGAPAAAPAGSATPVAPVAPAAEKPAAPAAPAGAAAPAPAPVPAPAETGAAAPAPAAPPPAALPPAAGGAPVTPAPAPAPVGGPEAPPPAPAK
jgi:protein translocase SecG subunit